MTSPISSPQWQRIAEAFAYHQKNRWLHSSTANGIAALGRLMQDCFSASPDIVRSQLNDGLDKIANEMELNAHYLSQKKSESPVGHCICPPAYQFPGHLDPTQPIEHVFENTLASMEIIEEAMRNANSQLEQVARYGFSISFEDRGGGEHRSATAIAMHVIDYKGRAFDLVSIPAGMSHSGNLTAFNRKDEPVSEHHVTLQFPAVASISCMVRGELGVMLKEMFHEPFALLKKQDGSLDFRSQTTHNTIERLKDVMYSAYSTIDISEQKNKKLTVIPFRSSHRSVIAQLNKMNSKFSQTLSFAISEGLTVSALQARAQQVSDESKKRTFSPETEGTHLADLQRMAVQSFIDPSNTSERIAMLTYVGQMLHSSEPSQEMERKAWKAMMDGAPITSELAWHLQRGILKAGAGISVKLPPADFKFTSTSLQKTSSPKNADSSVVQAKKTIEKPTANQNPKQPSKPAKTNSFQKMPGVRDEHIKVIENILSDHTVPSDNVCRLVIDTIQPGLYPYFVMHRIESMNHLVRSIRTSQDTDFVKTGLSMMLRTIESQWRDSGDSVALPTPTPQNTTGPGEKNISDEPKYDNSWRRRSR